MILLPRHVVGVHAIVAVGAGKDILLGKLVSDGEYENENNEPRDILLIIWIEVAVIIAAGGKRYVRRNEMERIKFEETSFR